MLGEICDALKGSRIHVLKKVTPQRGEGFPQAFIEFWDFQKVGGRWIARYVVNVWCESHTADEFAEQSRKVLKALLDGGIVVDSTRRLAIEDMLRKSQQLGMTQFIVKARG